MTITIKSFESSQCRLTLVGESVDIQLLLGCACSSQMVRTSNLLLNDIICKSKHLIELHNDLELCHSIKNNIIYQ